MGKQEFTCIVYLYGHVRQTYSEAYRGKEESTQRHHEHNGTVKSVAPAFNFPNGPLGQHSVQTVSMITCAKQANQ